MTNGPITLSDAIEEFLAYRKAAGLAANTVKINRRGLSYFLALIGNIQVRHLDAKHGEQFQAWLMGKGWKPNTVNTHLTSLSAFVKWLRSRRYLGAGSDPMGTVRLLKTMDEPRQRLHKDEFLDFLETAQNPHERIICALGLYLFLRSSEIAALKVGDVDLEEGKVTVHVTKSKLVDLMPISRELDKELRRWLSWYAYDIERPLADNMWLVPARRRPSMANDGSGPGGGYLVEREHGNCQPYKQGTKPHRYVKKVLDRFGVPLYNEDGKSNREGCHTLRRSGARALFDELVYVSNYDGALRLVSSMLHHKSVTMTEKYLGLDVDSHMRDDLLRGQQMFTYAADVITRTPNITELETWQQLPGESRSATFAAT